MARLKMQILKFCSLIMMMTVGLFGNACREDPSDDLANYSRSLREEFPKVGVISTANLAAQKEAPILLDVRSEEEFSVSHIPRAVRVDDEIESQLREMGVRKDRDIVVYCSVGYRSAKMAEKLSAAGYSQVRNLEGSIFAWTNQGRPLINAKGPTTKTHPYNRKWGRFLEKIHWQWKPE